MSGSPNAISKCTKAWVEDAKLVSIKDLEGIKRLLRKVENLRPDVLAELLIHVGSLRLSNINDVSERKEAHALL